MGRHSGPAPSPPFGPSRRRPGLPEQSLLRLAVVAAVSPLGFPRGMARQPGRDGYSSMGSRRTIWWGSTRRTTAATSTSSSLPASSLGPTRMASRRSLSTASMMMETRSRSPPPPASPHPHDARCASTATLRTQPGPPSPTASSSAVHRSLGVHITFVRDGVSESQFSQVLNIELNQIIKAYQSMGQGDLPKFTVIIAQKNHHTKLFQADSPDNVPPGTVVDSGIVHPRQYDFYMCAHAGPIDQLVPQDPPTTMCCSMRLASQQIISRS